MVKKRKFYDSSEQLKFEFLSPNEPISQSEVVKRSLPSQGEKVPEGVAVAPRRRILRLGFTHFSHVKTNEGTLQHHTVEDLRELIGSPAQTFAPKHALPTWGPFVATDNRRRSDGVIGLSTLVFDIDDPWVDWDSLVRTTGTVFEDEAFGLHSSYSARERAIKSRLLVPLHRPVTPDEHARLWKAVVDALQSAGVVCDPACKDAARVYFEPVIPPSGFYKSHWKEGLLLDCAACLERLPPALPPLPRASVSTTEHVSSAYADRALESECDLVRTAKEGNRNKTLHRAACSLLREELGLCPEDITPPLLDAAGECGLEEGEALSAIASAVRKVAKGEIS